MNRSPSGTRDASRLLRIDASIEALVAAADIPIDASPRDGFAAALAACTEAAAIREAALLRPESGGPIAVVAATSREVARHVTASSLDAGTRCLRTSAAVVHESGAPSVSPDPLVRNGAPLAFRREIFVPMRHQSVPVAVLALFDRHEQPPTPSVLGLVQGVADVAAAVLEHSRLIDVARRLASQLQEALTSRVLLEQAKGMLAERTGSDPDAAFLSLRDAARRERRAIAAVAADVVGRRPGAVG